MEYNGTFYQKTINTSQKKPIPYIINQSYYIVD